MARRDVRHAYDGIRNPCDLVEADVVLLGDWLVERVHFDAREAASGRLVHRPGDTHWSSAGRRAAAEELAARSAAVVSRRGDARPRGRSEE